MTIRNMGSNQTEISKPDGTRILYSYSTPVAAWVPTMGFVRTCQHYSKTTSGHINKWLQGVDSSKVQEVSPEELADL